MPARKIPLVWKGAKQSDQTYFKYSPASRRVVQIGCDCSTTVAPPPSCTPPDPVTSVVLSNLTIAGGNVTWTYGGPETIIEVNIYQSATLPVDTSGIPIFTDVGIFNPGDTFSFTATETYYYVASIRTLKGCPDEIVYSTYAYSEPVQYIVPPQPFQYTRVGGGIGDPGSGNFSIVPTSLPNVVVQFNVTDTNSQDATTWLSTEIATCNNIKIEKDLSNYVVVTRNASNDFGTFWAFDGTILLSAGTVAIGNLVTVTYD